MQLIPSPLAPALALVLSGDQMLKSPSTSGFSSVAAQYHQPGVSESVTPSQIYVRKQDEDVRQVWKRRQVWNEGRCGTGATPGQQNKEKNTWPVGMQGDREGGQEEQLAKEGGSVGGAKPHPRMARGALVKL